MIGSGEGPNWNDTHFDDGIYIEQPHEQNFQTIGGNDVSGTLRISAGAEREDNYKKTDGDNQIRQQPTWLFIAETDVGEIDGQCREKIR